MIQQAFEDALLVSKVQDTIIKESFYLAARMFEGWYPSLYNYKTYSESCQKRLRTANELEIPAREFRSRE
jgi:hypothetical protein